MSVPPRLTVPEFKRVALAYAGMHELGGSLHIVVADYNLKRSHAESCLTFAMVQEDYYGAALALLLSHMTASQRGRVADSWYEWHCEALAHAAANSPWRALA